MKTVVSILVGFCVAVMVSLLAGFWAHGLGTVTAWLSLGIGSAAALGSRFALADRSCCGTCGGCAWWRRAPSDTAAFAPMPPLRGWVAWSVVTVFVLFSLRAFCWLIFFKGENIAFLSPNNLGDLSLHLTYIRYLANGAPFWPENPIYAGAGLHYPFGVDLFNSLLTLAGVNLYRSLIWVGLAGCIGTGVMLWRWGGAFALAGFLFNGGVAGFAFLETGHFADYQSDMAWKSIPLALFVTQRGLLYAIPAGLALLWSWQSRFLRNQRGLPVWVEVLLYATMPIFHLHTFIFLSFLLGCWLLLPCRWQVARVIAWALIPATLLIWWLTGGFQSGSMIHWKAGWMQGEENPLVFWFENFGFLPLTLAVLFYWLSLRRRNPETAEEAKAYTAVVLPAVVLFLITCFVMFAPWAWDNTKLMIWCYLAVLPAIWAMLVQVNVYWRAVICCGLFFSGFISLVGGIGPAHEGYILAQRKELDRLEPALRPLPVTATFACVPTYNHPLLLLGRKVVAGYEGHLMSHGIDYHERLAQLDLLLRGDPGWADAARALHADFLYWGKREQAKYPAAYPPLKASLPVVAQGEWGTIYDLRGVRGK